MIDKSQRLLVISDLTLQEFYPARTAIAGAALIFHRHVMQFKHVEQASFTFRAGELRTGGTQRDGWYSHLQLEITQVVGVDFGINLTDQIGADFYFLRSHLHVIRHQPGVDPWDWVGAGWER